VAAKIYRLSQGINQNIGGRHVTDNATPDWTQY
jgi:hypothetical protein